MSHPNPFVSSLQRNRTFLSRSQQSLLEPPGCSPTAPRKGTSPISIPSPLARRFIWPSSNNIKITPQPSETSSSYSESSGLPFLKSSPSARFSTQVTPPTLFPLHVWKFHCLHSAFPVPTCVRGGSVIIQRACGTRTPRLQQRPVGQRPVPPVAPG